MFHMPIVLHLSVVSIVMHITLTVDIALDIMVNIVVVVMVHMDIDVIMVSVVVPWRHAAHERKQIDHCQCGKENTFHAILPCV